MTGQPTLPGYTYIGGYLLALFAASVAVGIALSVQGGSSILFGIVLFAPIAAIPIGLSGILIGYPIHFLLRTRSRNAHPAVVVVIGCLAGVMAVGVCGGLSFGNVLLMLKLTPFGALAGGTAGIIWWLTVLKYLNRKSDA